jgi:hypothetical protein
VYYHLVFCIAKIRFSADKNKFFITFVPTNLKESNQHILYNKGYGNETDIGKTWRNGRQRSSHNAGADSRQAQCQGHSSGRGIKPRIKP